MPTARPMARLARPIWIDRNLSRARASVRIDHLLNRSDRPKVVRAGRTKSGAEVEPCLKVPGGASPGREHQEKPGPGRRGEDQKCCKERHSHQKPDIAGPPSSSYLRRADVANPWAIAHHFNRGRTSVVRHG